jgi:hypothetical protein
LKAYDGIILQLEVNKMVQVIFKKYLKKKKFCYGASDPYRKFFYRHFQALARLRLFPDIHCLAI